MNITSTQTKQVLSDPLIHKLPCLRNIMGLLVCLVQFFFFFWTFENDWLGKDIP